MSSIPDNKALITKEMSEVLHNRVFSFGGSKCMNEAYAHMLKNEPHIANDVNNLIATYGKNTIGTIITMMTRSQIVDDKFFNALQVPINKMFENAFGAGIIYSQAKMEQNFIDSLKLTMSEEMNTYLDESLMMEQDQDTETYFEPEDDDDGDISIQ